MFSSDSPPGAKPAVQHRSQRSRDRLIDALDALLREKPFEAVAVSEIAGRAGVSVATVYQRFSNRDAAVSILVALYLRRASDWWSEFAAENAGQQPPGTLYDAVVVVGRAAWRQLDEWGHVMRPAYLYSRLRPDLLDEHWQAQEQRAVHGFAHLLRSYAGEIEYPDLDRAAAMVAYFVNMMFLGPLLHPRGMSGWEAAGGRDEFVAELARFVCGYLGAPARGTVR